MWLLRRYHSRIPWQKLRYGLPTALLLAGGALGALDQQIPYDSPLWPAFDAVRTLFLLLLIPALLALLAIAGPVALFCHPPDWLATCALAAACWLTWFSFIGMAESSSAPSRLLLLRLTQPPAPDLPVDRASPASRSS